MRLENFDLNLLVAIDAMLRRRSVTAAADELHITQSAMSSALKRARSHFEDEIFYYDGQNMVPTSFGRELEHRIPDMIAQLRALSRMRSGKEIAGIRRCFRIVASDYVAAVYVSELSKHLAEIAPNISLSVAPFTDEAVAQFDRGVIDFMVGPEFALQTHYISEPLFRDEFQCVLWRENPRLQGGFSEEDFYNSPLVLTNFFLGNGKSHFERWLAEQGREIDVTADLPSFVVLPHYVAGTMNVATIHRRLAAQFSSIPDIVFVDPPVQIPSLQEFIVMSNNHHYDKEAQLMAEVMLQVGRRL